jgi:hypothetical protein
MRPLPRLAIESLESRRLLAFDPSPQQQEMLEHVNRMRVNPQAELSVLFMSMSPLTAADPEAREAIAYFRDPTADQIRRDWAGLSPAQPLAWRGALVTAAMRHSEQMRIHDDQQHQLPGEPALAERAVSAGYTNYARLGENIYAYAESMFHTHSAFAIDWGVPSRGHRINIMNPAFREFGVGIVSDSSSATDVGPLVVTQNFGARHNQARPFLVGVVYRDHNGNGRYDASEGGGGVTVEVSGPSGTFTTTTMSAGGYQVAVPPGTYTVTIAGGGIAPAQSRSGVRVEALNGKVDFVVGEQRPLPTSPTVDLDGDGLVDLIWVSSTGAAVAHMAGEPTATRVLGGGGGWNLIATGDFDANGISDLVWQTSGGSVVAWLMNADGSRLAFRALGGDATWRFEATGDYNGDGRTDIIWRNSATGDNVMWLMNGLQAASTSPIGGGKDLRLVPTDAIYDADGDGRTDILWRSAASGMTTLWRMNGSVVKSSTAVGGSRTWSVVTAADLDGDGYGDLLWRDSSTGAVVRHTMLNGTVRSATPLGGDQQWTVSGTWRLAEFLGTVVTAVAWRHGPSGMTFFRSSIDGSSAPVGGSSSWRLLGRPGAA